MTVLDLLVTVNAKSRHGILYDTDGNGTISSSKPAHHGQRRVRAPNEQGDI